MTVLSLLGFLLLSGALLAYLGCGLGRLLVPRAWRSAGGMLAPLLGCVLLLLVGYYAVRTALSLRGALLVALGLATLLDATALWRWFRERPAGRKGAGPAGLRRGVFQALREHLAEHGWAWLIALAAFLLAVLPLLSYGYQTVIGENWDPENYLPITEYLVQGPVSQMAEMPPNPLRDLNADPPRIGMSLGFCIVQGTLQQLVGWDALRCFAPTIALLYGLTALSLYLLFRQGLQMGRRGGTLAALFGGLYALALWIAFFNFGMQMASLPLVPLALALWLAVLRHPSWRTILLAAAAVAALPVAYYPALTAFVPLALGLGLYELVRARGHRWSVLLAGLGTALLSAGLAASTIGDYFAGFAFRYSQQLTTLGLFHFPALSHVLGLAPFSRTAPAPPVAWGEIVPGVALLLVLLAWVVLGPRTQRWLWLAALLPALVYLAWLRGWLLPLVSWLPLPPELLQRLESYHYAYLKGTVFVVPLLWGLAVACWEHLSQALASRPRRRAWGIAAVVLLLVPLGLVLAADAGVVARYWERPAHFDQEVLRVEEAVAQIPPGSAVYLTGRPERSRLHLGLFAYFLREHPIQGRLSTAYGGYDYRLPGAEPTYALLDADDSPYALGFLPQDRLWAGGGMVMYRRDPQLLSFLDLREEAYLQRPGGEIHTKEPLAGRLLAGYGACPVVSSGRSVALEVDAARLSRTGEISGTGGTRALAISFAAAAPATVTVRWEDGTSETWDVPAGFSVVRSPAHTVPSRVQIASAAGRPLATCWAGLLPESATAGVQAYPEAVLVWPEATAAGTVLDTVMWVHNESGRPLRVALEVWENTFDGARHYAWWGPIPFPGHGNVTLRADMAQRQATAFFGDAASGYAGERPADFPAHPGSEDWPEPGDGTYFAALWIYYGAQVVEVLPVGVFDVESGQVQRLSPLATGPRPAWPHGLATPAGARFGPAIELVSYQRGSGPVGPGDAIAVALEWRALEQVPVDYWVSVQVQGPGPLQGQWDGPVGQWRPATMWTAGQMLRDDIPVQVARDAPPGHYRLAVIVYDPATGARLAVRSADGQELGDALDLGEIVVR